MRKVMDRNTAGMSKIEKITSALLKAKKGLGKGNNKGPDPRQVGG